MQQLQQHNKRFYYEITDDINSVLNKHSEHDLKLLLLELKPFCEVSLKYLKNMLSDDLSNKQKSKRINYILNKYGLTTKKVLKYKEVYAVNTYNTLIKEYAYNKDKKVYLKNLSEKRISNFFKKPVGEVVYLIDI